MAKNASSVIDLADEAKDQPSERKGAASASAPASEPQAAGAKPATEAPAPARKAVLGSVRDPKIAFEDDPKKVLPGMADEKAADMMKRVACHVIESFQGRTQIKGGTFAGFRFVKHEVVLLPKWFALSHPTRLVIKE
jgi:hypothetical protein